MKKSDFILLKKELLVGIVCVVLLVVWPLKRAKKQVIPLADRQISLQKRYNNSFVNDVFKDNILLTLSYLSGKTNKSTTVNWTEVTKPFTYQLTLNPDEVFAFHDDVLPQYEGKVKYSTNAHFNYQEGFKSDGYLMGDGVCHLASLINWVAQDADLEVVSPTNHDFAVIPEIPKEYGTSIYNSIGQESANALQNLYVKNNKSVPVTFVFNYDNENLRLSVIESKVILSRR